MRGLILVFVSLLVATSARAQTVAEKLCIFSAGQKLPTVPGLTIVASRIKDLPKELKSPGAMMVEIDVRAAGQDATFSFVCATGPGKPAFVEALGMSR